MQRGRARRRLDDPADDPGAARRAHRPARRGRARRARARRRRGPAFHRGAVAELAPEDGGRARRAPDRLVARSSSDPTAEFRGRRRLPLPPHAHPRRRLRRVPKERAPSSRALRRLARGGRRRRRPSTRRSSATTSSRRFSTGARSSVGGHEARSIGEKPRRSPGRGPGFARRTAATCPAGRSLLERATGTAAPGAARARFLSQLGFVRFTCRRHRGRARDARACARGGRRGRRPCCFGSRRVPAGGRSWAARVDPASERRGPRPRAHEEQIPERRSGSATRAGAARVVVDAQLWGALKWEAEVADVARAAAELPRVARG